MKDHHPVDLPQSDPAVFGGATTGPIGVPAPRVPSKMPMRARRTAELPDEPDQLRPDPVRWQVIDRLVLAGQRHARHLLDRHSTPAARPSRHAVAFVFHQPARGTDDGLRIATRMFLHSDDHSDPTSELTAILTALADRVCDYRRARVTHPLPMIIDRAERMTRQARYLATVTSSLDHTGLTDDPAAPRGWRGLAHLVDDTRIVAHHRLDPNVLVPDPAGLAVATTHTLAQRTTLEPFGRLRAWRYLNHADLTDPDLTQSQSALHRLHALITESEHRSRHHRRTS